MQITVKVSDILKKAKELLDDKIEFVDISYFESQEEDGEIIPACLHFDAYDGEGGGIDYDVVEEVEVSPTYKLD
ncbi:MAG: hypothetical protein K0S34_69 [Bacillales bacterium]|jgi:hypothetical protein|nr:hypothetical protein [Bacillales bacterium]